jgi:hypothetical protein
MNRKHLIALALAVAGTTAAGLAQARGPVDVQWSVTIGSPVGVYLPAPVVVQQRAPVYVAAPPVYRPHVAYPAYPIYRHAGWGDADRDGIPNRYDRVYNPGWDRDGDGVPNRYDRNDNRRDDRRDNGRGHGGRDGR